MTSLSPKPFEVVNDSSKEIKQKFLEGEPYQNNFPGPFQGISEKGQKDYINNQQSAITNFYDISETCLENQASKYNSYNKGYPDCEQYQGQPIEQVVKNQIRPSNNVVETFRDVNLTDPKNETGFGKITPEFIHASPEGTDFVKCKATDNPLLDIYNRPISQFSHNNMVPFYGAKLTQNMASTGVPQAGDNNICDKNTDGFANKSPFRGYLETFTGQDEMYLHKRETPVMFSPVEGITSWVYGTPNIRPDLDRFKQSLNIKNNETPVEKIRVGPGIATSYSVPAIGGFQQYTRILPNNVGQYKKNQLEGRVNAGKWQVSNKPTSQFINGVNTNRPKTYITQARRPTMKTKFYSNSPSANSSRLTDFNLTTDRGKQARPDTEIAGGFGQFYSNKIGTGKQPCTVFGQAPVGKTMKSLVPLPTQDLQSYNTIRETFKRSAAGYDPKKGGYWECPDQQQGSYRWGINLGQPKGSVSKHENREGIYLNFTDRGQLNKYQAINPSGSKVWSPNSYQDQPRNTTKQTTLFSHIGNSKGQINNGEMPLQDSLRVTNKETNEFSYTGNAKGTTNNMYTQLPDELRVSKKETTMYNYVGNAAKRNTADTNRMQYTGNFV